MTGLAPDSIHPAAIGSGSCESPGPTLYTLSPVSANPMGMAADRFSSVPHVAAGRIPAAGWHVDLRNGPGMVGPVQSQSIACGDVANPAGLSDVTVSLMAPPGVPDQSAGGAAGVVALDGGLSVSLTVHGLAPGSSHAAQVHLGTCEAQAAQLFPLTNLTAGPDGTATSTTAVAGGSLPVRQSYVVVRRAATADSQEDSDPILCGNLVAGP